MAFLTPDFVTREGINGSWEFNDVFIRRLASHCSAKNALTQFQNATLSDSDRDIVRAANADPTDAGCGSFAEHILFQQAINSAAGFVESLESATDAGVRVLLSNEGIMSEILQPFFGTYFRPYTRHTNKIEEDKELQIDIPSDIKQLSDLIERILARIGKLPNNSIRLKEATEVWDKISTLYEFRMKNPFMRLTCQTQEDYRNLILAAVQKFTDCGKKDANGEAISKVPRPEDGRDTSDCHAADIASRIIEKLCEKPIPMIVDGYTKNGRKESIQIANTKVAEKDWFSDPNLAVLFEVHPNSIANWRRGKGAPEGFHAAFEKKDIRAMCSCAEKYKVTHRKCDVMNVKGIERNISEEQIYKQGGNR